MARSTLVLARNISEANRYARAIGLERFKYRAVRHAGSIRGVRNAEVHLLSSFLKRPDRHAIMSALRQARTLEVFYVDLDDLPEFAPEVEVDQSPAGPTVAEFVEAHELNGTPILGYWDGENYVIETRGPVTDRQIEVAHRYNDLRDASFAAALPPDLVGSVVDLEPEPEAPAKGRRRTRCPKCEQLHFKDEPCVGMPETPTVAPADFF